MVLCWVLYPNYHLNFTRCQQPIMELATLKIPLGRWDSDALASEDVLFFLRLRNTCKVIYIPLFPC
jgi:hypothetical protein